jgi:hypothetical protein
MRFDAASVKAQVARIRPDAVIRWPAKRMANQLEHAIASSWRISALPRPRLRHSAWMPDEIGVRVSISSSPLHLPESMLWASLPGLSRSWISD